MKTGIEILSKGIRKLALIIFIIILVLVGFFLCVLFVFADKDEGPFPYGYHIGKLVQYYPEYKEFPIISPNLVEIKDEELMYTRVHLTLPYYGAKHRTTLVYTTNWKRMIDIPDTDKGNIPGRNDNKDEKKEI